jgi:hypothetical protein
LKKRLAVANNRVGKNSIANKIIEKDTTNGNKIYKLDDTIRN